MVKNEVCIKSKILHEIDSSSSMPPIKGSVFMASHLTYADYAHF